jgi:AcrR family transcriptional regulator
MGRKRLYDENSALEKAMYAFWERGFKGVTTRDLAQAMGINQYSLYASFDSKENLFGRALEYYCETVIEKGTLSPLSGENLNLDDLRHFFEQFVGASVMGYPNGCFICNSMIEAFSMNDQVDGVIRRYRNLVIDAFQTVLRNTYPQADKDFVHNKAEFLFGAFLGLAMQKRMGLNGEPIQNYVDEMMNAVTIKGE